MNRFRDADYAVSPGVDPTGPATFAPYVGTPGNNTYTGTDDDDTFDMRQGGRDTVSGKGGNDVFNFGNTLRANDRINGGSDTAGGIAQRDQVYISGNSYAGGLALGPHTIVNVEAIFLGAGHSYNLTLNDATGAAGVNTIVDGSAVGRGYTVTLDGSAETDGYLWFFGGAGHDVFTGGDLRSTFTFQSKSFAPSDRVDGGPGTAELQLAGNYAHGLKFQNASIKNIEDIYMYGGHSYKLIMADGNVAAGQTLYVHGPTGVGDTLVFNGAKETDGLFFAYGGPAHDVLIGGKGDDYLTGYGGGDRLTGGPGHDHFEYTFAADSTSTRYDTIVGMNFAGVDDIFPGAGVVVTGIDHKVGHGTLSTASFDHDLHAKLRATHLHANHAVLFTPDAGSLAGHIFLVIDANGTAGYQAGADW